jgi:hypothetical protein
VLVATGVLMLVANDGTRSVIVPSIYPLGATVLSLSSGYFEKLPVYANFTMRLLALSALFCLIGNAGPKQKAVPAIDLLVCNGGVDATCAVGPDYTLSLTGLDPKRSYIVVGTLPGLSETIEPGGVLNPSTNTLTVTSSVSHAGSWTFTLYEVNHNATPDHLGALDSLTIDFD